MRSAAPRTATEGMERLKEAKPDLIILDVMMRTSQEGFEFSRELKHNEQYKDIPILMLTGVKQKTGLDFKSAAGDESLAARRGVPRQAGQAERADGEGRGPAVRAEGVSTIYDLRFTICDRVRDFSGPPCM